jgi:hypothetical protein
MNPSFAPSDKEACRCVAERMTALSELARHGGLLALEEAIPQEEDAFVRAAFTLLTSGISPEELADSLKTMILSGGFTGKELLKRWIVSEAVLSMQNGLNPALIRRKLCTILGEEYLAEELFTAADNEYALEAFIDKLYDRPIGEEVTALLAGPDDERRELFGELEETIQKLPPVSAQLVFFTVSDGDILNLLRWAAAEPCAIALRSLPALRQAKIIAGFEPGLPPAYEVCDSAEAIMDTITRLRDLGEIVLRQ